MTTQEAQKKLGAIQSALAGLDPETIVIDVSIYGQPSIHLAGSIGLDGMKQMAADNNAPLEVDPDRYELGDEAKYVDYGVQVFAIIREEK